MNDKGRRRIAAKLKRARARNRRRSESQAGKMHLEHAVRALNNADKLISSAVSHLRKASSKGYPHADEDLQDIGRAASTLAIAADNVSRRWL